MDINQLTTIVMGAIIATLLGGVGYSVKTTIDQLTRQVDRMNSRLDTVVADIADIKPKIDAVWNHFLENNKKL